MRGIIATTAIALLSIAAPSPAQQEADRAPRTASDDGTPAAASTERTTPPVAPEATGLAAELSRLHAQERDRVAELAAQLPTSTPDDRLALQRRIVHLKATGARDRLVLQLSSARDDGDVARATRLQQALDHAQARVADLDRAATAAPVRSTSEGGDQ